MTDLKELATAERRDLADFLDTLTPEQWQAPTLCSRWTVAEVVAHAISYEELGWGALAGRFVKGRLSVDGVNAAGVDDYRDRSPAELVALLRAHVVPRGLTAGFGGGIALTDGLIHHQDIRRGLGVPREVPVERVLAALPFALRAPTIKGSSNAKGVHLLATDVDWEHGAGPDVRGPVEALLMAVAGRPAALADLTGEGVALVRVRLAH